MEFLYETAGQIVELSRTIKEGLIHINERMDEGKLKETIFLFEDVLEAFSSIEIPIQPVLQADNMDELQEATAELKRSLEMLAQAFEANDLEKARAEISQSLIPSYSRWQLHLEQSLKAYRDS
ncbi:MAG: hypothetical protein PHP26_09900 [Syntrophomonas sp.]|uniref:hypothetical protein n=1 Tax=Syntrophomonas sp. TaxID=2053627 RepID=UPI00262BB765|nr:hypothetical protein [Syntrophomonas sp.]MDD2511038.1 hypothetical protein [Syntrophomonas sp.]MDD3880280.1 hypothetical protein [Syntrophomonas sp.]MDD4627088.1 hypothetical protein [Syntrophomonas sp.]